MTVVQQQVGKNAKPVGVTPSILLINPKYKRNVGNVIRVASCFGVEQVIFTGDRVSMEAKGKGRERLPREERMKGYNDVTLINNDYPFNLFPEGTTPVAVEVREHAETLPQFVHPENPLYVFGPEDGGLTRVQLQHCHRVVIIPTRHCLNLSIAVSMVMYDRLLKRIMAGQEELLPSNQVLSEQRGWWSDDDTEDLLH